jgi:anti-sigma factor RsiW
MCDYSTKLVALLDGELAGDEQAELQRHVQECMECRTRLAKYQEVSRKVHGYCLQVTNSKPGAGQSRLPVVFSIAAPAALAVILFVVLLRPRSDPALTPSPRVERPAVAIYEPPPAPAQAMHRRDKPSRTPAQTANTLPPEPAIRIAIPAESMFPPGAVPEGVSFSADVSFGPEGWAQQVRLRPNLAAFKGRSIEP